MTVKDAKREDRGDFKLKLKNDQGESSVTIPVDVIGRRVHKKADSCHVTSNNVYYLIP